MIRPVHKPKWGSPANSSSNSSDSRYGRDGGGGPEVRKFSERASCALQEIINRPVCFTKFVIISAKLCAMVNGLTRNPEPSIASRTRFSFENFEDKVNYDVNG